MLMTVGPVWPGGGIYSRIQAECNQIVARMQPECCQNVARMQSECSKNVARIQSECCQNVVRMQSMQTLEIIGSDWYQIEAMDRYLRTTINRDIYPQGTPIHSFYQLSDRCPLWIVVQRKLRSDRSYGQMSPMDRCLMDKCPYGQMSYGYLSPNRYAAHKQIYW